MPTFVMPYFTRTQPTTATHKHISSRVILVTVAPMFFWLDHLGTTMGNGFYQAETNYFNGHYIINRTALWWSIVIYPLHGTWSIQHSYYLPGENLGRQSLCGCGNHGNLAARHQRRCSLPPRLWRCHGNTRLRTADWNLPRHNTNNMMLTGEFNGNKQKLKWSLTWI